MLLARTHAQRGGPEVNPVWSSVLEMEEVSLGSYLSSKLVSSKQIGITGYTAITLYDPVIYYYH